jgi:NitT/TauT family transport system ATP-binding protein
MALVLSGVTHQFGETKIFENLNLEVREGCFCCVTGPSGCGKSTLLRIIAGLYKPVDGDVFLDRAPPSLKKGEIGFVFQEDALFPWYTVEQNITFALKTRNIDKRMWNDTVEYNLRKVGLAEFRNYYPTQLSGGMKQRAAIARVLAYNPKLLLMDEPFASLDSLNRNRLQAELIDLWTREKKTIVFVTHNIDEAVFLAERVIIMGIRPGRIEGVMDIDLPRPRNRTGADFCRYRRKILDMIEGICPQQTIKIKERKCTDG